MSSSTAASELARAERAAESTEAYRARYRLERIPGWYSGRLHVATTALSLLVPAGYFLSRLRDVRALEWLTVPAMLVLGSALVWVLHKYVLHRSVPGLRFAYVLHTVQHHRFFTYEHGEPESARDFHITLFPMRFGPTLALIGYGVGRLVSAGLGDNVGWLVSAMAVVYFGLYELVHFASHLPASSRVLRLPLLGRLREHHRLHHDPRLMGRYNFNIVLPLFDWLLGTLIRERPAR